MDTFGVGRRLTGGGGGMIIGIGWVSGLAGTVREVLGWVLSGSGIATTMSGNCIMYDSHMPLIIIMGLMAVVNFGTS